MVAVPEVSVVIPALNARETLPAQLEALARQKVSFSWEILVCDNGSTDGTADLVREWAERVPGLVVVDASERRGPGAARNFGAAAARAKLLVFCDADDIVSDSWLAEMREALRANDFVAGTNDYVRLHSRWAMAVSRSEDSLITMPYWPRYKAAGAGNLGIAASVFAEVGGFDESLMTGEDVDLCWRVQLAGHTLTRSAAAVAYIRKRRGLASVARQAYSYGVGNRILTEKYSSYIAEYWRLAGAPVRATPPRVQPLRTAARLLRRLRPNGLADTTWQISESIGLRRGAKSSAVEPLAIPPA
jgi:glycosyltransferase involved in cell wall biosynthesis